MPQRLLQTQLEGRLFGSFLVCIDLCCAIGLCVVLPRGLLTAVRYGSLTVFRFNYSTAKEAWRDQGTFASISRNFPFRPHWNVSLLLCQAWCPRMTLLLWLLPRRSEPTEKRCWCQKRNFCNFRPLHFVLTGWVAEELSSLCAAFSRTQSSWDPDLLGGHVVLSDLQLRRQNADESDRHLRLKDQGHQEDALCSTPPDLQASRVFAAAPCSH